jgi:hypothetical protein
LTNGRKTGEPMAARKGRDLQVNSRVGG